MTIGCSNYSNKMFRDASTPVISGPICQRGIMINHRTSVSLMHLPARRGFIHSKCWPNTLRNRRQQSLDGIERMLRTPHSFRVSAHLQGLLQRCIATSAPPPPFHFFWNCSLPPTPRTRGENFQYFCHPQVAMLIY